jgi:hypothetical protein
MAVYAQVGVLYFGLSRPSTTKFLILALGSCFCFADGRGLFDLNAQLCLLLTLHM